MPKSNCIPWIKYFSLLSIGLLEGTKLGMIYTSLYFTIFTIGIFGSIVGFLNATQGKEKLQSLASITVQLFSVTIFIQMASLKTNILNLISDLEKDESSMDGISTKINDLLIKRIILLLSWTLLLGVLFNVPTIYFLFQEDLTNSKETLVVPFWFSCSAEKNSKGVLRAVCWKINTKVEFLLTNAFQMIVMLLMAVTLLSSFVLYSVTMAQLVKHLEGIKSDLRLFAEIAATSVDAKEKNFRDAENDSDKMILTDEFLTESFLVVFKHQQLLFRRTLQMVNAWKGFVTCYSTSCNLNLILILFILRTELSGSIWIAFKSILCFLFFFLVAFIISYNAQAISDLNEHIFQELISIQWYGFNSKFRKVYLTTLILNQTSVKVKIAGVVQLNLNTFAKMVKAQYSILNVLLLKYGK